MHKTFAQFILHTFWCILMRIDAFWALRTKCTIFARKIVIFSLFSWNKNHFFDNFVHKTFSHFILYTFWCSLTHIDTFWALRTKCRKFHFFEENYQFFFKGLRLHPNVFRMNYANVLYAKFSKKLFLLHLNRLNCINMHQNASKCIKMYAEWIVLMFCAWNFNLKNFNFLDKNSQIFF